MRREIGSIVWALGGGLIGLLALATILGWIRRTPRPGLAGGALIAVATLLALPALLIDRTWCGSAPAVERLASIAVSAFVIAVALVGGILADRLPVVDRTGWTRAIGGAAIGVVFVGVAVVLARAGLPANGRRCG
jgi:hypothetical protein